MIEFVQMKRFFATRAQRTRRFHEEAFEENKLNIFQMTCPHLAGKTVGTGRKREVILVGILDKFLVYIFCHKEQRFHEEVIESYKLNIFNIILINQLEVKLLGKHKAVLLSLSHVLYQVLWHMSYVLCPISQL